MIECGAVERHGRSRPWLTPCGVYLHQSCFHIHLIWNCHLSLARRSSLGIAGITQITVMTAVFRRSSEWWAGICLSSAFKMKVSPRNVLAILNDQPETGGKGVYCRTSCGLEAYSFRLDKKIFTSLLRCQGYMCGLYYNWWPCCAYSRFTGRSERIQIWPRTHYSAWRSWRPSMDPSFLMRGHK